MGTLEPSLNSPTFIKYRKIDRGKSKEIKGGNLIISKDRAQKQKETDSM